MSMEVGKKTFFWGVGGRGGGVCVVGNHLTVV